MLHAVCWVLFLLSSGQRGSRKKLFLAGPGLLSYKMGSQREIDHFFHMHLYCIRFCMAAVCNYIAFGLKIIWLAVTNGGRHLLLPAILDHGFPKLKVSTKILNLLDL